MRRRVLAIAIVATLATAAALVVSWKRKTDTERMRAELIQDVERGGIAELARAQELGRRLFRADPDDHEAGAALAFTSALMALDHGLDTAAEAQATLARIGDGNGDSDWTTGVSSAARALCLLHAGDRDAASRGAVVAVAASPGIPHPLYALGRARALAGDLAGATRALEGAIVASPSFSAARVAWVQVRLDSGDAKAAHAGLKALLLAVPGDGRARLLLDEAEQSLGIEGTGTLRQACPDAGALPAMLQAGCTLARALRARRSGARAEALGRLAGAAAPPGEPRLVARTAQALAQLGAVDRAVALLERSRKVMGPEMPALAWASAAVTLGRGRPVSLPTGTRPADPETHLLAARAALAAGGVGALGTALDALGPSVLAADSDLRSLARLRDERSAQAKERGAGAAGDDPLRAYVAGLRAQMEGDLPAAAQNFRNALAGHGDACRAAGEYVATLRAIRQRPDPAVWTALRAENAGCTNLPPALPSVTPGDPAP